MALRTYSIFNRYLCIKQRLIGMEFKALSEMLFLTGKVRVNILENIENSIMQFFEQTMQMDSFALR